MPRKKRPEPDRPIPVDEGPVKVRERPLVLDLYTLTAKRRPGGILIRTSEQEEDLFRRAAGTLPVATWARQALYEAAGRMGLELPPPTQRSNRIVHRKKKK